MNKNYLKSSRCIHPIFYNQEESLIIHFHSRLKCLNGLRVVKVGFLCFCVCLINFFFFWQCTEIISSQDKICRPVIAQPCGENREKEQPKWLVSFLSFSSWSLLALDPSWWQMYEAWGSSSHYIWQGATDNVLFVSPHLPMAAMDWQRSIIPCKWTIFCLNFDFWICVVVSVLTQCQLTLFVLFLYCCKVSIVLYLVKCYQKPNSYPP